MIEHKHVKQGSLTKGEAFNYKFSDSEWTVIIGLFERNRLKFSPVIRNNISKLINSMTVSRTITTAQQANTIIALLLCNDDDRQDEQRKICINCHDEKKTAHKDKRVVPKNEMIKQIRLLITQYQALENHRITCLGREYDRR